MRQDEKAEDAGRLETEKLAGFLKPLSNARRLELLLYLREPRYLEEIASHLRISRQAASEHVEALQSIGLLARRVGERQGKNVVEYVLAVPALYQVHEYFERLVVKVLPHVASPYATQVASAKPGPPEPASRVEPVLTSVHGLELGRQFPLSSRSGRTVWTVGREAKCDIRVEYDTYVSSRHAEIRKGPSLSGHSIVDAFSRNGTSVNWVPIRPGEPRPLTHGDLIGVGRTLLMFWERIPDAGTGRPPP